MGGVLLSTGILCKVGEARLTEEEEGSLKFVFRWFDPT